jgi:hypothetical protein
MIRVDHPAGGPFVRLRRRLYLATRKTRRALEERRRVLRAAASAETHDGRNAAARQDLLVRDWQRFEAINRHYDALVGVLCAAAHTGVEPDMETEYGDLRVWFCQNYPRAKPMLTPFLQTDPSDGVAGRFGRRSCDAFEALFFPQTIAAMLQADGGNLIGRLMRTQEALAAWERGLARQGARRVSDRPDSGGV